MRVSVFKTWPAFLLLAASSAWAVDHRVTVGGSGGYYDDPVMRFSPEQLTIAVGDTVTFVNAGGTHNVAANNGSFRCAQGCDGQGGNGNPSGAAWSATVAFNTPGSYGYRCEVHEGMGMRGTVIVQGVEPAAFELNQHGLSGSWANPLTNSQGIVMEVYEDLYGSGLGLLFGGWFTFDVTAAGGQRWYTIQGQVESGEDSSTMPIYLTQGGQFDTPLATATTPVGEATIHFDNCTSGKLDYSFTDGSGRSGQIPLTRLLQNVTCSPTGDNGNAAASYLLSGAWADPGNSGQGLVFDFNPPQDVFFAAWYTFASTAGQSSGPGGQRWYTLQALLPANPSTLEDIGIYDSTGGLFDLPAVTSTDQVGTATLVFHTCSSATLTYAFNAGANAGISGALELARVGPAPSGCTL
jgi:plastocyanin